jgi:hypothetical protein
MKNSKDILDGRLVQILKHICLIYDIKQQKYISVEDLRYGFLARIIVEAREQNANWIWSEDEIKKYDEDDDYFSSPSVDIASFFVDSHNDLEEWMKENGYKVPEGFIWDTESSAWYPKAKTENDLKRIIKVTNKMFDDKFLKKLKDIKSWE